MSYSPTSLTFRKPLFSSSRLAAVTLVSSLLAFGNAGAVLIDFTTAEGYSNGTLNGQPSATPVWATSSDTGTPFTVNTSGSGSVSLSTAINSRNAGYNFVTDFATIGTSFTSYIEFTFVQSTATVGASTTAVSLLYSDTQTSGSINSTTAGFGRNTLLDGYRMASFAATATNIAGTALGIDSGSGDTTSDVIRMSLTLTRGATSSTWSATETIFNVTTGTQVATASSSAINIGVNDPATFFNAMALGASMTTSGLSSVNILAYSSPVPEPSTWALITVGGTLLITLRRRRQQS
ncbi:hypothetical protein BH09VER1_BH09VER1_52330 [soil metagenome]